MIDTLPLIDIPGLTTQPELEALFAWAQMAPPEGLVVELGTFQGRATAALCYAVDNFRVLSIDTYEMQHHGENNYATTRRGLEALQLFPTIFRASSTDHVFVGDWLPPIALLFIDTDHRRAQLERELDLWLPYLVPGGILVLHDTDNARWPDVAAVASERLAAWPEVGRLASDGASGGIAAWRKP